MNRSPGSAERSSHSKNEKLHAPFQRTVAAEGDVQTRTEIEGHIDATRSRDRSLLGESKKPPFTSKNG